MYLKWKITCWYLFLTCVFLVHRQILLFFKVFSRLLLFLCPSNSFSFFFFITNFLPLLFPFTLVHFLPILLLQTNLSIHGMKDSFLSYCVFFFSFFKYFLGMYFKTYLYFTIIFWSWISWCLAPFPMVMFPKFMGLVWLKSLCLKWVNTLSSLCATSSFPVLL